jgi:hypothetical protein
MTPQEFLLKKLDTDLEGLEQYLYDFASECDLTERVEKWMKKYAKLMCEKQKEICAEEAKLKWEYEGDGSHDGKDIVDIDSILNSPFPDEI